MMFVFFPVICLLFACIIVQYKPLKFEHLAGHEQTKVKVPYCRALFFPQIYMLHGVTCKDSLCLRKVLRWKE